MENEFKRFFEQDILEVRKLPHKGNNQLFKVRTSDKIYLLKKYSTLQNDNWNRGRTEFNALTFLSSKKFKVPKPINYFDAENIGIYSFEKGRILKPEEIQEEDVIELANFLAKLHSLTNEEKNRFPAERTACLCISDYLNLLRSRYHNLINNFSGSENEKNFLEKEILPEIEKLEKETLKKCRFPELNLTIDEQVLTRGDVAFNNVLIDDSTNPKKHNLIDFEYFGRDDPVRPLLDFLHHDQTREISNSLKEIFLMEYKRVAHSDDSFDFRLRLADPLIGMNWVLIYLNVLSKNYIKHLEFAHGDIKGLIESRILKAKEKINNLNFFK